MSRACFWRREPTFEVRPGDCVPAQLPGSRTRQRRDCGASHHGELAAPRPRTPDPGLGQKAPARGTHLGRAAEARGGEGERRSRHVASSYFLPLSLTQGWGRGSEEPRKTFFQVAFGVAKLLWRGCDGCQLSEARVWGDLCSGARPSEGFLSSGWEGGAASCATLVPPAQPRITGTLAQEPAGCAPSDPARPSRPRAPAQAASLSRSARPPPGPRPQLSRRPSARWRGWRGRHKGR